MDDDNCLEMPALAQEIAYSVARPATAAKKPQFGAQERRTPSVVSDVWPTRVRPLVCCWGGGHLAQRMRDRLIFVISDL